MIGADHKTEKILRHTQGKNHKDFDDDSFLKGHTEYSYRLLMVFPTMTPSLRYCVLPPDPFWWPTLAPVKIDTDDDELGGNTGLNYTINDDLSV